MISIDKFAYASKLRRTNPGAKLLFSVLTLAVCLWADSVAVSVTVILIMGGIAVLKGGIPPSVFLKLLLLPMAFLVIGVLTVAVTASQDRSGFLLSVQAFGTYVGASRASLLMALNLFFKALGAVSCLYFLSLCTPMTDLLALLRRLKVPKLVIELMSLIYRFIFVLLETAETMIAAQNSRLGYSSPAASYRSVAMVASTLFIRAYKRSGELFTALEARGYDGELNVLEEKAEVRLQDYALPVAVNLVLIAAALLVRKYA